MKKFLPILVVALSLSEVWGQGVGTVGGLTRKACVVPTVTSGSAYASGNNVGGLLQLSPAWRTSAQGAPDQGGVVQSIRLNFKSAQTAPFKAHQFVTNPSSTTWTDHTTIVMATADDFSVRP